jgi:CRP-like cAMP-binding protein
MAMDASRLAALPILADLPDAELAVLAETMREVSLAAGEEVVAVDDYGTGIFFIEEGEGRVVDVPGGEAEALGPGDTFGEVALLLTGQRTATVVSRTPMRLLALSGQDFELIRPRVPELERSLRRLGVERAGR